MLYFEESFLPSGGFPATPQGTLTPGQLTEQQIFMNFNVIFFIFWEDANCKNCKNKRKNVTSNEDFSQLPTYADTVGYAMES